MTPPKEKAVSIDGTSPDSSVNKASAADHLLTTPRVLVCGGRMYGRVADDCPEHMLAAERERAGRERMRLYGVLLIHKPSFVLHGGAYGADEWAGYWAELNSVPHRTYPADWTKHGKAAGPIRNQRMLDEGKPDIVIAFPGGRGTADMVRRAKSSGVKVIEVSQ